MDILQNKQSFIPLSPNVCIICLSDGKFGVHLLLHWPLSRQIWDHFLYSLHLSWVMSRNRLDLLEQWYALFSHPSTNLSGLQCFMEFVGGVFGKNVIIEFLRVQQSPSMRSLAPSSSRWFHGANPEFKGFSISDISNDFFSRIFFESFA